MTEREEMSGRRSAGEFPWSASTTTTGGTTTFTLYRKMKDMRGPLTLEYNAIFGPLCQQPGCIERFDVYTCFDNKKEGESATSSSSSMHSIDSATEDANIQVILVDVRIGNRLNGHDRIVHGGIISCIMDEAFGWGYEAIQRSTIGLGFADEGYLHAFTANMHIQYRNPLPAESDFVVRVYHDKERSEGRKVYLKSKIENCNGSVVYIEATALFIQMKSKL